MVWRWIYSCEAYEGGVMDLTPETIRELAIAIEANKEAIDGLYTVNFTMWLGGIVIILAVSWLFYGIAEKLVAKVHKQ